MRVIFILVDLKTQLFVMCEKLVLNVIVSLIVILCSFQQTTAQQQIIGNSGGNIQNENGLVSWTIGEPVITTIKGSDHTLTQGFHQSKIIITEIEENTLLSFEMKVYPNPVATRLTIYVGGTDISGMRYNFFDGKGAVIKTGLIVGSETHVSVEELVSATYYLKIYNKKRSIKTFKIIKP